MQDEDFNDEAPLPPTHGNGCLPDTRGRNGLVYNAELHPRLARGAFKLGATDAEVADMLGVTLSTITRWRVEHTEFARACKLGKGAADERVEQALYHRAIGWKQEAVKIMQHEGQPLIVPYTECFPADTTACIFWLRNRRRKHWTKDPGPDDGSEEARPTKVVLEVVDGRRPDKPVPPLPSDVEQENES